ncbi:hypothetical protein ANTRET_LOCUS7714 [Anthophora retusa]
MSCCKRKEEVQVYIDSNNCVNEDDIYTKRCTLPEPQYCLCRSTGISFASTGCHSFRCADSSTITTCLEPCQCAEEIEWNCYVPPKPGSKWLSNFCELRRQWSNHARKRNCKCCNCKQWLVYRCL